MKNALQSDELMLSPEQQILVHSTRLELDDIAKSSIKSIILNNPNWQEILVLSARYGIQPLLKKQLSNDDFYQHIPGQVLETLNRNVFRLSLKSHLIHSELSLFLDSVIHENIPVILLKGAFLADSLYQDIALRPMNDIDILCQKKDIQRIDSLLVKKSYSQKDPIQHVTFEGLLPHLPSYTHPNGVKIEVHTHIFPQLKWTEEHIETIWENSPLYENSAAPIHILSLEDLLFYLVIHLHKHLTIFYGVNLYWMSDIHEIIQQFGNRINWHSFFELSDSLNATEAVRSVFQLMKTGWRTQFPTAATERITNPIKKIPLSKLFSNKIDTRKQYAETFKHLLEIRGWQNKIKFCFYNFFPTKNYIKWKYQLTDHSFIFIYYLRYPLEVLWLTAMRLTRQRDY